MKVRTLLAVVLAALLVPAAAFAAPAGSVGSRTGSSSRAGGLPGLSVGGFVGYETDDVDGFGLRVDGELPFGALGPGVNLSFVGTLGYSRLSLEDVVDFNVFKLVPAARFSFPLNPQFSLFADGGLGLYRASFKEKIPTIVGFEPVFPYAPIYGTQTVSDSEISFMMRIGGGAFFQVNDTTRIGAMLEIEPFFGDFDQTLLSIQFGAMFRM